MKITIVAQEVENHSKYNMLKLTFRDEDGKIAERKVASFGDSAKSFATLSESKAGEVYEITMVKGEKFWQWTNAVKQEGLSANTKANTSPKSTYETPEERAKKQVYIVRQSSIASAVALKKDASPEEIIAVAKQFEQYVFDTDPFEGMEDDHPF